LSRFSLVQELVISYTSLCTVLGIYTHDLILIISLHPSLMHLKIKGNSTSNWGHSSSVSHFIRSAAKKGNKTYYQTKIKICAETTNYRSKIEKVKNIAYFEPQLRK